ELLAALLARSERADAREIHRRAAGLQLLGDPVEVLVDAEELRPAAHPVREHDRIARLRVAARALGDVLRVRRRLVFRRGGVGAAEPADGETTEEYPGDCHATGHSSPPVGALGAYARTFRVDKPKR